MRKPFIGSIARSLPYSVCIPAYNEANVIGVLLTQLRETSSGTIDEILVCANGCTDGTEAVVQEHRRRDPRVRLLSTERGKPQAWNALMRAARNDIRIFLDADVRLAPGFFAALTTALERNTHAVLVAARDVPRPERSELRLRLAALASRAFGFDYVCGRGYALRSSMAKVLLNRDGTPVEVPQDVLAEDLWLELRVGRPNIAFASGARLYYDAGTLPDLIKTRVRLRVARRQLKERLPLEFQRWKSDSHRARPFHERIYRRLKTTDGLVDTLLSLLGGLVRLVVIRVHRDDVRRLERAMLDQMERQGGHLVLGNSGRLSKGAKVGT